LHLCAYMLFTIKRPKSERFFQLSFKGFRPKGRNKIERYLGVVLEFIKALLRYLRRKIGQVLYIAGKSVFLTGRISSESKAYVTRKLIWSRGRLGKPLVTVIVMSSAFLVFTLGEVLNGSKLVNSQEISPDYLSSVTDIIPQRNNATTTIPENRQRTEPTIYLVEGGDTLYSIGEKFKISVDAITYVNNLSDTSILKIGQEVVIPPVSGLIHKIEKGDTLQSIATKYDVPVQAIADFNYILDTSKLAVGTELVIPGAKVPQAPVVEIIPSVIVNYPSADTNASRGWCMWPTTTRIVTQYFSWYHNGVDIATSWNNSMPPIYSCGSGRVIRAGWDPWGLGLHVRIAHPGGYTTIYGHMSRIDVSYGDEVSKGERIGVMGSTGHSTGPHVHFTVEYNGVPQNPLKYVN
jgi:murein DD-endopeptidase MepM/ murein hydrolase activator NlpD